MEFELNQYTTNPLLKAEFDKIENDRNAIMQKAFQEILQKREDQILEKLKENGFEFENRAQLLEFAKNRCELLCMDNKLRVLKADGKVICEWWETSRFENDGQTFTCIIGEAPASENDK